MAILKLSTQMKKMWRNNFAQYTGHNTVTNQYTYTGIHGGGTIQVFSGTINDFENSTVLYQASLIASVTTDGNNEDIVYSTSMSAAVATGTATWFRLSSNYHSQWVYGTVGLDNSGSDLMIGSTAITSGQSYVIGGIKIRFTNSMS